MHTHSITIYITLTLHWAVLHCITPTHMIASVKMVMSTLTVPNSKQGSAVPVLARSVQDSLWPMPSRPRHSTISLEGLTSWLWPFGLSPSRWSSHQKDGRHTSAISQSASRFPRSASSSTLDLRKICTTVLFVCSRTPVFDLRMLHAFHI